VIVVASVSCIYNIGSPEGYREVSMEIKPGQKINRHDFLTGLVASQYQRNDIDFKPGTFRVRGNSIEIFVVTGEKIIKVEFFGDEIEKILEAKASLTPKYKIINENYQLFPAHFWMTPQEKIKTAIKNIKIELDERLKELKRQKKMVEFQRLEQRVNYDMEMLLETGFCYGIENYSRHLEFRKPGQAPYTLIDYFSDDFLIFVDESHQTLPQIHAMSLQDKARKKSLIEFGFRLPSAIDNRPLNFEEFEQKQKQVIYVSATPAKEELEKSKGQIVEQIIRPTGLLEPVIEIRPTKNQVKDLIEEIKKRVAKKERVLALTMTKRLAEALSDYLEEEGILAKWLHSEIKTLERPKILKELREGKYDVLVGINLLREGLDIPEVTLVAILDADKEGFLRSETTLIQTMGRAARHVEGHAILYADKKTTSMKAAIAEIGRRKKIQEVYNKKNHITPKGISKEIRSWDFGQKEKEILSEFWMVRDEKILKKEMETAAKNLDFERAAEIRDLIKNLKSGKENYTPGDEN
jgi:excinuclease ABC subunit B